MTIEIYKCHEYITTNTVAGVDRAGIGELGKVEKSCHGLSPSNRSTFAIAVWMVPLPSCTLELLALLIKAFRVRLDRCMLNLLTRKRGSAVRCAN